VRSEGCEALLVQEYEYARFDACALLGRRLGLPVFATFQGGDRHAGRLESLIRRVAMRAGAGFAVAAPAEARRLMSQYRVPPERIWPVHNPVDLDLWYPEPRAEARRALGIPADVRMVIWHGRAERHRKGLDILLDAWGRVRTRVECANAQLMLIGSGPDDRWLRERLERLGGSDVRWVDRYELDRTRMRRYLSAADVYALPSRVEGLPVAVLEAMACGLPVVASAIPALAPIVERGFDSGGVLLPVGDVVWWAETLAALLDDAPLSAKLGLAARRGMEERFSPIAAGAQLGRMLAGAAGARGEAKRPGTAATSSWRRAPWSD
ncbi:MAG: glycosyltransferase family 4 protein, partial [Stellaceae bacterium]